MKTSTPLTQMKLKWNKKTYKLAENANTLLTLGDTVYSPSLLNKDNKQIQSTGIGTNWLQIKAWFTLSHSQICAKREWLAELLQAQRKWTDPPHTLCTLLHVFEKNAMKCAVISLRASAIPHADTGATIVCINVTSHCGKKNLILAPHWSRKTSQREQRWKSTRSGKANNSSCLCRLARWQCY